MSDPKFARGIDSRIAVAGPHTTLDDTNFDKGMPSVGDTLLYQLRPESEGMAYSRPFLVTSVDSRNQHVSGWLLRDARLDSGSDVPEFVFDIPFDPAGQVDSWHWPVRGYTGRSDAPTLTPVGSTEVTAVSPESGIAVDSDNVRINPDLPMNPVIKQPLPDELAHLRKKNKHKGE